MAGRKAPDRTLGVACLLIVASTVGWRRGEYFSGSLDPVVVAKGLVSVAALVLAIGAARGRHRLPLGTGSLWFLAVVLVSSVLGALTHAHLLAGAIVAVRVAIVAATVFFLLKARAGEAVLRGVVQACAVIGSVAALSGYASLSSGRLQGGIPPLSPNELALLSGLVVIYVAWSVIEARASWFSGAGAVVALGVLWATGSRTALLTVVAAIVVMVLDSRRLRPGLVVAALLTGALGVVAVTTTGVLVGFLERDGAGTSTLDSRFVAWRAALGLASTFFQITVGSGLSVKIIPIVGEYNDTQPLDSSWVSLLVQTGVVGILASLAWVLWTVRGVRGVPRPDRALVAALVVFLVVRSTTESGLFDATPAFAVFLLLSLTSEGGSRVRHGLPQVTPGPARSRMPVGARSGFATSSEG